MTHPLHHSTFSGNGSSQDIPQGLAETSDQATAEVADCSDRQPDLALEIQVLQILESSDDCIKVLDLAGRLEFAHQCCQIHTQWRASNYRTATSRSSGSDLSY